MMRLHTIVILLTLVRAVYGEGPSTLALDPTALARYFDSTVPALMEKLQVPGVGIVVVKGSDVVLSSNWELSNLQKKTTVQNDRTIFRLGSVSKPSRHWQCFSLPARKGLH